MTQKEFVNLEMAMQELYARREKGMKEYLQECAALVGLVLLYTVTVGFILFVIAKIPYAWLGYLLLALPWYFPASTLIRYTRYRKGTERRLKEVRPTVIRTTLSAMYEKELVKHEGSHYKRHRFHLHSYFTGDAREYQMGYWYEWYVLYFPEGRFTAPLETFLWSKENVMNCKGLFRYVQPGDEFYLLIGQTWYGEPKREILLACPAKLFRWEESEISEAEKTE